MTILCIDAGNSRSSAAVFGPDGSLLARRDGGRPAEMDRAMWKALMAAALEAAELEPPEVGAAGACSTVPSALPAIDAACRRLLGFSPVLPSPERARGLKIRYGDPRLLGADRLAAALAARERYPDRDIILMDLGTACTLGALSASGEFLGGAILPGPCLAARSLRAGASALRAADDALPRSACAGSTEEGVRSGIHWGLLGALRELCRRIEAERFPGGKALRLSTGGGALRYEGEGLYDAYHPHLVLEGTRLAALAAEGD